PVGKVLQGAGLDLAAIAIAFPQKDGGRRAAVRHGGDIHAMLRTASAAVVNSKSALIMPTPLDRIRSKSNPYLREPAKFGLVDEFSRIAPTLLATPAKAGAHG